ncbi:MAG: hypothetical protein KBC94_23160 [Pseudacidovorax sp.]|nr:hypothetical protein [Pseudacidovorax sp.]
MLVARALAEPGRAAAVATLMGLSESTVSRIRNERVDEVLLFLAHLGLKVVPSDFQCVDQKTFGAFQVLWERAMSQTSAARLIFEDAD